VLAQTASRNGVQSITVPYRDYDMLQAGGCAAHFLRLGRVLVHPVPERSPQPPTCVLRWNQSVAWLRFLALLTCLSVWREYSQTLQS
jgi:hypothetical protein